MRIRPALAVTFLVLSLPIQAQPELSGIWMISGPPSERDLQLTDEGQRIQAEYDLLVDDPSLYCVPASTSRVWANPNVRIAFQQSDERILISYEFYDLRRDIPIGDESEMPDSPSTRNVSGTYFPEMGSSFAYYEGDRLIIESRHHAPGYVRTSRGVPQSVNTTTTEELWIEDGELHITQTHYDETLYAVPFVLDYVFRQTDETELPLYECTDADYDWFNELNSASEDEPQ